MKATKKKRSAAFKAKVAIEAIKEHKTLAEEYGIKFSTPHSLDHQYCFLS